MKNKNGKSSEDLLKQIEEMGDDHVMSSIETPMREGAFDLSDEEKIAIIQAHFEKIMQRQSEWPSFT